MFEHILLAVDGSDHSKRATEVAAAVGKAASSEVLVLHVREHDVSRGVTTLESSDEATELVRADVETLQAAGVTATGKVVGAAYGHAAKAILSEAADHNADVIVMGTRGLSDMAGLMVGSTAHKVLHLSDRPVLVVR